MLLCQRINFEHMPEKDRNHTMLEVRVPHPGAIKPAVKLPS